MVAVNLPVPLFWGSAVSEGPAEVGMLIGIALVTPVGMVLCGGQPIPMRRLCHGSIVVALSQFYPVLHMCVGTIALTICRGMEDLDGLGPNLTGTLQVTAATILTGLGLILPSLILGYFFAQILKMSRDSRGSG